MEEKTKEKLEKVVDNITKDQQVWWDYEKDEQMIINSLKSDAREEGLAEGRTEEKLEIAEKLKKMNIDFQIITEATGLSIEEIEKL